MLYQTVARVPGKAVTLTIFIGQGLEVSVGVVAELNLPAMGIYSLAHLPAASVLVAGGVTCGIGIADQQPAGVTQVLLDAAVRHFAL
ncbi:hypothetical protein PFL603g_05347 [Pseudomonas fluorescens]|uniref:Uncharacterized protein n=1 Tax=Pseudomonas fluorescens TaxID=294 RepID=A0A109KK04_PSEFL|nr:hypothetical protein PFL603g_05347 [Pseudomonas fluorescens]